MWDVREIDGDSQCSQQAKMEPQKLFFFFPLETSGFSKLLQAEGLNGYPSFPQPRRMDRIYRCWPHEVWVSFHFYREGGVEKGSREHGVVYCPIVFPLPSLTTKDL